MCRIAGIYNPASNSLKEDVCLMRDSMKHGGPDGEGIYIDEEYNLALGHRRLALLDLSIAGIQPMQDAEGQVQLVFNGEIYNYLDLRNELKTLGFVFKTQTDTEIILNSYKHWGIECFRRFNGMFAIVLWDKSRQELILARDHAGIKPLYYYKDDTKVIFASEIRAFKVLDKNWPENKDWKALFLAYGHLPEPITTLLNVKPLEKGTYLKISIPSLAERKCSFHSHTYSEEITDAEQSIFLIKEAFSKAVERHLISDAPLGIFLSGGVDSSIITLLASKKSTQPIHTLSVVFDEVDYSEEKYQYLVAQQAKSKHQTFKVTQDDFRDSFSDILSAMDQPSTDGINAYFISKYAKETGLKAVLSGIGADELLGGYTSIKRSSLIQKLKKAPNLIWHIAEFAPSEKVKRLVYLKNSDLQNDYLLYRGLYTPRQIALLLDVSEKSVTEVIKEVNITACNSIDPRQKAAHVDYHLYMQNQLLKDVDYMGMWHGVEVRVPFLDKQFIKTVNKISPSVKFANNKSLKWLLTEAFKEFLPQEIYNRRKQGFTFPFQKWMRGIVPNKRTATFKRYYFQFKKRELHWSKYWAYCLTEIKDKNSLQFLNKNYERIKFLNLSAFAFTGGIEKFNRSFLKSLNDLEKEGLIMADAASLHDIQVDGRYFTDEHYQSYQKNTLKFVLKEVLDSGKYHQVFIGHINLAWLAVLTKILFPKVKVSLITHGIEVWEKEISFIKKKCLSKVDEILAVSHYTKSKLIHIHHISENKITIFPNTIDPYFKYPSTFEKPDYLLKRYNLSKNDKVLFTLARLKNTEKYKGYDKVIEALPEILKHVPNLKYILGGKSDDKEKQRIESLIKQYNVENAVIIAGFISENEVSDHYLLADIFILPSQKEGFGIVFIEAMACGTPVIGGNKDGSVDALLNGRLGTLVNPEDSGQIQAAILSQLQAKNNKITLQEAVIEEFDYNNYLARVRKQLTENRLTKAYA